MLQAVAQLVAMLVATGLSSLAYWLAIRHSNKVNAATARVSHWLSDRVPDTPPVLAGPVRRLELSLARAHLAINPWLFLFSSLWCGILGARLVAMLANPVLSICLFVTFALLPITLVRRRAAGLRLRVMKTLGPILVQLTKVADVRTHPYLALQDAVPAMDEPLRSEFTRALQDYEAGMGLSDAIRDVAERLGRDPYIMQLSELVDLSVQSGANFGEALFRLLSRYRHTEELRAEEQTQMKGYSWLTWVFYLGSLLPLPYWLMRDPGSLPSFQGPIAGGLLLWVFLSGLGIVILPTMFSVEEG
ncbi:MAG: hypothetical protein JWN15_179 [Firmicutes bacterium]|nr:hypothetical protein [Bacillota bacterium]